LGDLPDLLVRLHDLLDTTLTTDTRGLGYVKRTRRIDGPRRSGARFLVAVTDVGGTRVDDRRTPGSGVRVRSLRVVDARSATGIGIDWDGEDSAYRWKTSVIFFLLAGHAVAAIRYDAIRHGINKTGTARPPQAYNAITHATRCDRVRKQKGRGRRGERGGDCGSLLLSRNGSSSPPEPLASVPRDRDARSRPLAAWRFVLFS